MKLTDKLYMQSGGYRYHNGYYVAEKAMNIPLYAAAGYGQGIMTGKGLGFNENSQQQLGILSAVNNGLNSAASLNNTITRNQEEKERFREERRNDYYRTPRDRYRYDQGSESGYSQDYFRDGGELTPFKKGMKRYKNGGFQTQMLNQGKKANNAGNFHQTSFTKRLYDEYHPVNYRSTYSDPLNFSNIVGTATADQQYQLGTQIPESSRGLYDYPNQVVKVPTPNGEIQMDSIPYPVLAIPDGDSPQVMYPDRRYKFKNSRSVTEIPLTR